MASDDLTFDRALLNQRRSRAARHATGAPADFLLRRVGDDLVDRLRLIKRTFAKVLVLGAYHGLIGRMLAGLDQVHWIVSAESCPEMVQRCDPPKILADDEWLPVKDGALDLIVSPLHLQFANDVPGTLVQIRRALKNDGLFLAALLGGDTLTELRQAWLAAEAEVRGGASPRVAPFGDIRDFGALLQRAGFALPVVDSERLTVTYDHPLALMRDLKAMGAGNVLTDRSRTPVTKTLLQRACDIYSERFTDQASGRIRATFEILTLTAWSPDVSQQQPLKPGTAKMRLADALGADNDAGGKL